MGWVSPLFMHDTRLLPARWPRHPEPTIAAYNSLHPSSWKCVLSRVIRPQSAARMRSKLVQALALAFAADQQPDVGQSERRDILAYVLKVLDEISTSVTATSTAWEKRGYWVKADRFMGEWSWVRTARERLMLALEKSELQASSVVAPELAQRLSEVKIPTRVRQTKPWTGAWESRNRQTMSQDAE